MTTGKERCCERISGEWRSYRCSRNAVKDGYCKQHHPDEIKKRKIKSEIDYMEKERRRYRISAEVYINRFASKQELIAFATTIEMKLREAGG